MSRSRKTVSGERVKHELLPGESTALLAELHILTRDGKVNADSLRKLKQVNHLVTLVAPAVEDVLERFADPVIVDCGAGKGYLGFVLYELFLKDRESGTILNIESRPELAKAGEERAQRLGYARMKFVESAVDRAPLPAKVHLVTALHACDTATDDALALAIGHDAEHIAVVPCCQAEVARQLKELPKEGAMAELFDHPIHRREFGSHLTNVVRGLVLETRGYKVTVTELTGWEHSLKNELILAKKVRSKSDEAAGRLRTLLESVPIRPRILGSV